MKKLTIQSLILAITVTASIQAWSYHEESDYLSDVSIGSEIVAITDIHIKPNSTRIEMFLESKPGHEANKICEFEYSPSKKSRLIFKGTRFKIIKSDHNTGYTHFGLSKKTSDKIVLDLFCYRKGIANIIIGDIKISEAKAALSKYFVINLADPESF